jgi:hypothetical protein
MARVAALPPSVDSLSDKTWLDGFDFKSWTLAVLPHVQLWPGYAVRDPSGHCISAVCTFVDRQRIEEVDVRSGSIANEPRKGKYNLSLSVAVDSKTASAELIASRELTAKHGARLILAPLTWVSKMIIGPEEMPDLLVLDGEFTKTLAWFVFQPGKREVGKWQRLPKGK